MNKFFAVISFLFLFSIYSFAETNENTVEFGKIPNDEQMYTAEGADATFISGIIGAATPGSDYEYHGGVKSLQFDKESGFTITPTDPDNPTNFMVSLGSSWTELIPSITNQTILPQYQGTWTAKAYEEGDIVYHQLLGGEPNYWVALSQTTEEDVPGPESSVWAIQEMPGNLRPSGEEKLSIKIVEADQTGTFWDYSNTNKDQKTFYIGINKDSLSGNVPYENVYLSEDINVANLKYPIGRYKDGDVITNGTRLDELFKNMFRLTVYPTYTNPTFSVTFSPSFTTHSLSYIYEIGRNFNNEKVTAKVQKWDAGAITNYEYFLGGELKREIATTALQDTWTMSPVLFTTQTSITVKVYYSQGDVKPDSDGHPYEPGRIEAGVLTNNYTFTPSRYIFYGTSIADSIDINTNTLFNMDKRFLASEATFKIDPLPIGTKQIVLAMPTNVYASTFLLEETDNPLARRNLLESENLSTNVLSPVYCMNGYKEDTVRNTYLIYHYDSPNPTISSKIYITIKITPK